LKTSKKKKKRGTVTQPVSKKLIRRTGKANSGEEKASWGRRGKGAFRGPIGLKINRYPVEKSNS